MSRALSAGTLSHLSDGSINRILKVMPWSRGISSGVMVTAGSRILHWDSSMKSGVTDDDDDDDDDEMVVFIVSPSTNVLKIFMFESATSAASGPRLLS